MTNRFEPPASEVADIATSSLPPSWPRTVLLIFAFSCVSLVLAWFVAPIAAAGIAMAFGVNGDGTPPEFLALDILLSMLSFFLGAYLAARLSRGHFLVAAASVGVIGFLVYFYEIGGLQGMLNSELPLWYEFFPSHAVPAVAAWLLTRRAAKAPDRA